MVVTTANRTSIWARPERGARGPAPSMGRAQIAAAAMRLADAAGLAAVSMRAVSAELGTAAASLYRYVDNREDLLDLMVDAAVSELDRQPPTGQWLDDMVVLAQRQLDNMRRHPWLPDAMQRNVSYGPHVMDWFDHCLWVLEPVDCGAARKLESIAMMTGVVTLFARSTTPPEPFLVAATPQRHPHLFATIATAGDTPPRDLFPHMIRTVLTGLLID